MAEVTIAGQYTERKSVRFIRDCLNPTAPLNQKEGAEIRVLQVAAVCPTPDEVIVNGLRYLPEKAA
jgi:hypothetical protein